jgi:hypothetical protein
MDPPSLKPKALAAKERKEYKRMEAFLHQGSEGPAFAKGFRAAKALARQVCAAGAKN